MAFGGTSDMLETRDIFAQVSVAALPWLTARAGIGQSEAKTWSYGDGDAMWLVGATARLWRVS